ncbi:MAG: adenylate/guanylate cyclase domain-containing protein [Treponema sp.]|nr:adenylate/guanylate cyclase domain-containing protein [Treponema sp.]
MNGISVKLKKIFINWKNLIIGLAAALVFSLLYALGVLTPLEDRLYDFFLRFRINRERPRDIVFLDVDDLAVSYYGIYPWPRSIPADSLLRLKEYGARAVIFDIEYIDKGPQGVDSIYLDYGMGNDFFRSFSEIDSAAQEILTAIRTERISRGDIDYYAGSLSSLISSEHQNLLSRSRNVARDNDLYLAQAIALNGRAWSTINLRSYPLEESDIPRRYLAQEKFALRLNASPDASLGGGFIDVLPALPIFAQSAKGAGFVNVLVDGDGVRRRIYLAQNINDHWYAQLAFAPLLEYFGSPEIKLEKRKMILKNARMPDGVLKDISIPLDSNGCMMLDWPKENYFDSYSHISFAVFSQLDRIETELELYSRALASADLNFFARFDQRLGQIPGTLSYMEELFEAAHTVKNYAMEYSSGDYFEDYLIYRDYAHELIGGILKIDNKNIIRELSALLAEDNPGIADNIVDEAGYIISLIEALEINLNRHIKLTNENNARFHDKFVIIGRVDTGTTDIGVNPFYGVYINVGTHGVVLDTILSESFITPLGFWWSVLIMLLIVPIFFHLSGNLPTVTRAVSGLAASMIILAASVLLFRYSGIFLNVFGIVIAVLSALIVREIINYSHSEKEKHFIRSAFSTYVSHDVVKEIISDPSRLQLGGTKRHMTAIFTDVKGFSTISEKLDPEELVSLLNKYLSAMSDIVLAEKGTIDKFEGDAIIAFFGAPNHLPDHALRACISAVKMKKIENELNKIFMEQNHSPVPLLTRIGINTGDMVAGNMGTNSKMNYTIMGNAVNLAARLEGVNKQYGTWILASEQTVKEAVRDNENILLYRKLDRVRVVGINEPVRLCELLDMADNAGTQDKKLVSVFHEALEHFENRRWDLAEEGFNEVISIKPSDAPSLIYLERIGKFSVMPPEDSWDSVYNLTLK